MDERLVVGRVSGVFGTRGWVKVQSYTRPRENLLDYTPWQIEQAGVVHEYDVAEARRHHGNLIVSLVGVDDRDQAAALIRGEIIISRADLKPTEPGEYYWADLIGLEVYNLADEYLGSVAGLFETAAHDVLQVNGERERLIPFVRDVYVHDVDLTQRRMRVDWHRDD